MNAKIKKIDQAKQFLEKNLKLFKCPICDSLFNKVDGYSLVCVKGHRFDLSKKGTLYLLKHAVKSDYDDSALWQARRNLLQHGLFDGVINQIIAALPSYAINALDIGCGEGTVLTKIAQQRKVEDALIGFDISKEAIKLATQQPVQNFYCVADLAALPFQNAQFDVLIDILSPSSYHEFKRVLKSHGFLFKVVPNADYLVELRHLLYDQDSNKYTYSNQDVIDRFGEFFPHYQIQKIRYTFPLSQQLQADLIKMTPLQWGTAVDLQNAQHSTLKAVTVDFSLLIAQNV